ncbi:hypothetical protein Ccrd_004271 [Cynara cardunculus var. scolymus]|uniref:Uncharacterized protein n=1 Tax=Cynara cardunculus var. scolymus TaxID=59895 RepID=A0A103XMS4_CYNCS|nr:hypothetical protein Ccrd_004271 [Cynara cardunculus var. scolymus]
MEDNEDFSTEFDVPPFPSPSDITFPSFIPPSEEETSKKRKRTTELSKMVEATKNSIDEATTQMKRLALVISDSTPEMDGLREELSGLGLGLIEIIQMGGHGRSNRRFWCPGEGDNEYRRKIARFNVLGEIKILFELEWMAGRPRFDKKR